MLESNALFAKTADSLFSRVAADDAFIAVSWKLDARGLAPFNSREELIRWDTTLSILCRTTSSASVVTYRIVAYIHSNIHIKT